MNLKRLTMMLSLVATLGIGCSPSEGDVGEEAATLAADCTMCHLLPMASPHPAVASFAECATCHASSIAADGVNQAPAGTHQNGTVDVSCGGCHGNPPPAPHPATGTCASCHGNTFGTTQHQNNKVNLLSTSCRLCHGVPPSSGQHSRHSRLDCGRCHSGFSRTTINAAEHMNGSTRVSVRCHCGGWSGGSSGGWGGDSGGSSGGWGGR